MSTTPPNTPPESGPDVPADAQPTAAYPAGYGQPADAQPTEAYAAAYGQPAAPPAYAPAPTGPDTRSKRVAWTALALAIAGTVAALAGFVPILWVGFALALLAGLLLLDVAAAREAGARAATVDYPRTLDLRRVPQA